MIYFFYPSNMMGGAEYLMVNTANLLKDAGVDVGVVDYSDGWVSSNINDASIKKIFIIKNEKIQLSEKDILITTASYLYKLDNYFSMSDTRVLFWVVQPYNVVLGLPSFFAKNKLYKLIGLKYISKKIISHKKNLEFILDKKGIVSMDSECDRIINLNYGLNYNNFLPIFVGDNKFKRKDESIKENDAIKIVWLGRIDLEFKIHILKKVLLDLNLIKNEFDKIFIFNIIGNGPGLENLKLFVKENLNFDVNFLGELKDNELNFILEQSDIGFAMGTSALDIAAKKIPTILLDFSYEEVSHYNYRWIFETEGYILGRDIKLLSNFDMDSMKSLRVIFHELNKNQIKFSELCFNYVYINHSSQNTLLQLSEYLVNTELTIKDIYDYSSTKPIWNKISYYLMKLRK
ncbi:glycosyltransferase [Acinetobacter ursingii]|uniref:glycosyltransferase n=1 Tax=Acinetobacter ursingii TaxID=108980 RepID=UPI001250C3A3|nr:glycosyltransferase [Acinetobacter ursingii]